MSSDAETRDVHICYECGALDVHETMEIVQKLVDSAIERLLVKASRFVDEEGPIKIRVEHIRKGRVNENLFGEQRYLKVYIEGHDPCIITAY